MVTYLHRCLILIKTPTRIETPYPPSYNHQSHLILRMELRELQQETLNSSFKVLSNKKKSLSL